MEGKLINIDGDDQQQQQQRGCGRGGHVPTGYTEIGEPSNPGGGKTGGKGDVKTHGSGGGGSWPWSKRDRLQRHASLGGTVDEDSPIAKKQPISGGSCESGRHVDYFGVRSYLHNFYETYGTDQSAGRVFNVNKKHSAGHCGGYWWKTMAMFGVGCLVIGIIAITAGFLTPQRPIIIGASADDTGSRALVDRNAASFDLKLEICRLVGLTMFCAGGLILAVALMIPTFLYRYCGDGVTPMDGGSADDVTAVMVDGGGNEEYEEVLPLPVKIAVPATEKLTEVQPPRRPGEMTLVGDEPYEYQD